MTRWLSQHTRSLILAFVLLTAAGLAAAVKLPVSLFPRIDFPGRVVVSVVTRATRPPTRWPPRSQPGRWSRYVARRAGRRADPLDHQPGRGRHLVELSPGATDMVSSTLQTQAAVNAALPDLPPDVTFTVQRRDPTVFPVLGYALSSATRDLPGHRLRRYADLTCAR